jgi:hypothetical protein
MFVTCVQDIKIPRSFFRLQAKSAVCVYLNSVKKKNHAEKVIDDFIMKAESDLIEDVNEKLASMVQKSNDLFPFFGELMLQVVGGVVSGLMMDVGLNCDRASRLFGYGDYLPICFDNKLAIHNVGFAINAFGPSSYKQYSYDQFAESLLSRGRVFSAMLDNISFDLSLVRKKYSRKHHKHKINGALYDLKSSIDQRRWCLIQNSLVHFVMIYLVMMFVLSVTVSSYLPYPKMIFFIFSTVVFSFVTFVFSSNFNTVNVFGRYTDAIGCLSKKEYSHFRFICDFSFLTSRLQHATKGLYATHRVIESAKNINMIDSLLDHVDELFESIASKKRSKDPEKIHLQEKRTVKSVGTYTRSQSDMVSAEYNAGPAKNSSSIQGGNDSDNARAGSISNVMNDLSKTQDDGSRQHRAKRVGKKEKRSDGVLGENSHHSAKNRVVFDEIPIDYKWIDGQSSDVYQYNEGSVVRKPGGIREDVFPVCSRSGHVVFFATMKKPIDDRQKTMFLSPNNRVVTKGKAGFKRLSKSLWELIRKVSSDERHLQQSCLPNRMQGPGLRIFDPNLINHQAVARAVKR